MHFHSLSYFCPMYCFLLLVLVIHHYTITTSIDMMIFFYKSKVIKCQKYKLIALEKYQYVL